jgi:hypothetical protein
VGAGEFKEWRWFIMRDPRAVSNFTLSVARPISIRGEPGHSAQYILYSDRDRWTQRDL